MIDTRLEDLRRRLLDLTRRNRLLNLRPGARSFAILRSSPAEAWRQVVEEENALSFLSLEEAPPEARAAAAAAAEAARDAASADLEVSGTPDTASDAASEGGPDPTAGEPTQPAPNAPVSPAVVEHPAAAARSEPPRDASATATARTDVSAEEADAALPPVPLVDTEEGTSSRRRDRSLQTPLEEGALEARLLFLEREARSHLEEQGCNVLYLALGLVEWCETRDGPRCRAPLVFVPVALERRSVGSRHTLRPFDDDVLANPCLAELLRQEFRVEMPAFEPEAPGFSLDAWLAAVATAIDALPGWSYAPEVHLGLFSFAKLLLWRDLDPATWPEGRSLAEHPLIRLLSGVEADDVDLGPGMPDPSTLDQVVTPEDCFQVVDADSSQMAAIQAAKNGSTLVVEGPPGTGKSQTITNVIAECLAQGKRVLFVAEKAAALDVVKTRLEAAGLGGFLLELHSRKASKRLVLEHLAKSFEAPRDRPARPVDLSEVVRTRDRLNAVRGALHAPVAPLGLTPFQAVGRVAALADAPEAAFALPDVASWTSERLRAAREAAEVLDRRSARVPDPASHPWRGAGVSSPVPLDVRQRIPAALAAFGAAVGGLEVGAAALGSRLGVAVVASARAVEQAVADARALAGLDLDPYTVGDPRWDAQGEAIARWLDALAERARAKAEWTPFFRAEVETEDWAETYARQRSERGRLFRFLDPSWRRDRRRVKEALAASAPRGADARLAALGALASSGARRDEVERGAPDLAPIFGPLWSGIESDPVALRRRFDATRAAQALVARGGASAEAVAAAATPDGRAGLLSDARAAEEAGAALGKALDAWFALARSEETSWFGGAWLDLDAAALRARHDGLGDAIDALDDWAAHRDARLACEALGLSELAAWAERGAARGRLADAFERQALRLWTEAALAASEPLRGFRGEDHTELVRRFQAADRAWLEANRRRVAERLRAARPASDGGASRETKLGLIRAQMRLKRRHLPLRRLFEQAGDVIQAITPCFLMSPISVAHYLAPGAVTFDLVVFDEASQVEPADAYGAIARARQAAFIGDENQLPPTAFFAKADAGDGAAGEGDAVAAGDLESILALATVRLPERNRCALRWHYRSRHPSLIAFSNREFYDGNLVTFPVPRAERGDLGVSFRHVESASYKRGAGQFNPDEAAAVAAAVMEHARVWARVGGGPTLGVGAFSVPQQRAIEDEIERRRREDAGREAEPFFRLDRDEPFFVKNLETIQGDERDVVLLSVGYGRDPTGRMTLNFGPLNLENGWRRLNVLVTRARARCEVFSSVRAEDLRLPDAVSRGVSALKRYLAFAERGRFDDVPAPSGREPDSPLEAAIARALRERGHEVHAQVGAGPYFVDLAVVDPDRPGTYLLGIECDGATYHAQATARDRDRLRQEVLERNMGWRLERVWSPDWFHREGAVLDRLEQRIETERRRRGDGRGGDARPAAPAAARPPEPEATPARARPSRAPTPPPPATGAEPYPARPTRPLGDAERLAGASPSRIADWLAEIVEREGPIHRDEARRALAARFGTRATARPREAFERGLRVLLVSDRAWLRGEFLWPDGMTTPPVRHRGGDCPVTDPALVCPEELQESLLRTLEAEFGGTRDGVVAAAIRRVGWLRGGPKIRAAFESAFDSLVARDEVVSDPAGHWVLRKEEGPPKQND